MTDRAERARRARELYESPLDIAGVASALGCTWGVARKLLQEAGVVFRPKGTRVNIPRVAGVSRVRVGTGLAYVYALRDSRTPGVYRYVGQTLDPVGRLAGHLSARGSRLPSSRWIAKVLRSGGDIYLLVLEECLESEVDAAEQRWIIELRERGHPLMNVEPGGRGFRMPSLSAREYGRRGGRTGGLATSQIVRTCRVCGMKGTPGTIGNHQRSKDHAGYDDQKPLVHSGETDLETSTRSDRSPIIETSTGGTDTGSDPNDERTGATQVAQEHVVRLIDDLDGGPATQTLTFGWEGRQFEIDLNDENANALAEFLKPYVGSARVMNARPGRPAGSAARRSTSAGSTSANAPIRDWARANGFTVADGGRLPQAVRDAYFSAHPGEVDNLADDGEDGEDTSDELEVEATADEPNFAERGEQDAAERVA